MAAEVDSDMFIDVITLSRSQVEQFLRTLVAESKELVALLRLHKEGDGLKPEFRQALANLRVSEWARVYEEPKNEIAAPWLLLNEPGEIKALVAELKEMTPQEQSNWLRQFMEDMAEADEDAEDVEPLTKEAFEAMSSDERQAFISEAQRFLSAFMPVMFNYFSKMVHGKSMYQLVAEAKEGNFQSLLDAVQIDKSTITTIPYFIEANHRAADEGRMDTLRQINTYRTKPMFRGHIKYSTLWLVFAVLDDMGLFEQFEKDIERFAVLCQELRVYGPHPKVEAVDVEAFEGRIGDYKKHRKHLVERSQQRVIVKDESSPDLRP